MSLYHGWDREAMLQAGSVDSEASENMSGLSLSSFTPINHIRAPVQFISPQETLNERGLDDDTSYQHTLEATPEVSVQKGKKRGAAQTNKGRAVSIGRVWEYRDEGDVAAQNQGADFESSFPKRRKSAPAKRTKPVPGQPKNLQDVQKQDNSFQASLQNSENGEAEQASQLTCPPDSNKRAAKKAAPKPRNTKFKQGPFRNPVITKPSVSHETRSDEDAALAKPITIHQGWTSTEEAVKHKFNGISKTTLDKLAAFRYKSSVETEAEAPSPASGSLQVAQEPVDEVERPPLSSDYSFLPSDDPIFNEGHPADQDPTKPARPAGCQIAQSQRAAWTPEHLHGDDAFFSDAIWNVNVRSGADDDAYSSQKQLPANDAMSVPQNTFGNDSDPFSIRGAVAPPLPRSHAFRASQADARISRPAYNYSDPLTNETREFRGMVVDVDHMRQRSDCTVPGVVNSLEDFEDQATAEHVLECGQNTGGFQLDFEGLPDPLHDTQADDSYRLPQHSQIATENAQTKFPNSRHVADVQVERSDIDEPLMTPRDMPNDFELDEFDDDGVDDADLLAIASDAAIPETQPLTTGMVNGNPASGSSDASPRVRSHENQPTITVAGDQRLKQDSMPTLPEMLSDDAFPLEDGLEEEDMMSLPTHLQSVIETFQAPPSLEYSFANGPMSGEVYDKSLQFSPPKSRPSSVLPGKAADGSVTDGHSPSKAQRVEDLESDPAEEEDWSFIRSNDSMGNPDVSILSDRMPDQEITPPDKIAKRVIPLGPQKQRKRSTYAKVHPATQSSSSQEIVLDDSHDYEPLQPFARPDFPTLVLDRCPIVGVSARSFLRVCFRVGEMFREGARCNALKQDAVIELFARVTFSSREPGTTKQHFQLADLWHDRPPFPNGILANYKTSGLAESESRAFIGAQEYLTARCIGRLRRDTKNSTGWLIDIINIRPTDWEEIKWTKRVVSAGLVKSEKGPI